MPASRAASAPEAAPAPPRPGRSARSVPLPSDDAVSEVVGQVLMFGILSMVLILSLLGFGAAKDGAEERVAALEAESVAQRVAGVYITASLFAEKHADDDLDYERRVDLPETIQQRSYTVSVQEQILILSIPSIDLEVSTSLLSAGAPPDLVVCDQVTTPVPGGPLHVRAKVYDSGTDTCDGRDNNERVILFLESA